MPTRTGEATWEGDLKTGKGNMKLSSGAYQGPYSFKSRFEDGGGTNPEELVGAALAGCYSMALAHALSEAGFPPRQVHSTARVSLEKSGDGFAVPKIELVTEADVPGIHPDGFQQHAAKTKLACPIAKLLAAAEITLDAKLVGR